MDRLSLEDLRNLLSRHRRALDAGVGALLRVENVVEDDLEPAHVLRNLVVVLGRDLANEVEARSGDVGKVMVLVVVPDVPSDRVQRAVVCRYVMSSL